MNEGKEKCTNCIYFHRDNKYCECIGNYINNVNEAKECWCYHDALTLRVQDEYIDDYEEEDSYDDNEGRY